MLLWTHDSIYSVLWHVDLPHNKVKLKILTTKKDKFQGTEMKQNLYGDVLAKDWSF